MTLLKNHITWHSSAIPATSAFGSVDLHIGEVGQSRPRLLITAGIHGDEGPWGAWAIHKLLNRIQLDELKGSIRIIPVTNPLAMQADKRNAPVDQLDLNRSFPGDPSGSYTERIAYVLANDGLANIDYVIDLHGGGSWCVNSFVFEMEGGTDLSFSFPAPFIVNAPSRTVTLTGYAQSRGAVGAGVEMGGRSQFESQWADKIADGLFRALVKTGIVEPRIPPSNIDKPISLKPSTVLRPTTGGVFIPTLDASQIGTFVPEGTLLGQVLHPATHDVIEEFRAPFAKTALMLLRPFVTPIEGGAMTYVVSEPIEQ